MGGSLSSLIPEQLGQAKHRVGRVYRPCQQQLAALLFDRKIDTAEPVSVERLGGTAQGQNPYVVSGWFFLRRGLAGRRVGPGDVFVDFGSGKGRLMYQAARLPFDRVVGIECYDELNQVARANIERNRSRLRCQNVELITGDITATPVPDDMTIAYMFNPLRGELFRSLMGNVVASIERRPRSVRLIYASPWEADEIERTGAFRLIKRSRGLRPDRAPSLHIYESRGPRPM
jgi:hypothetical protein